MADMLGEIHSPRDLKKMRLAELARLCREIRQFLIHNVTKTGGHLSSNLGVVELTVAIHRCFSSPRDVVLFDVGHQSYVHKLLTGRREGFGALRQLGGLSGFPSPAESAHDPLVVGHASTALSSAIGIAHAKKLKGEAGFVIAVIGDGAFTGGLTYEGLNNVGTLDNLIVVLNDNAMSISKNVGALAQYLTKLRTSAGYHRAKDNVKAVLGEVPLLGEPMTHGIQTMKTALRQSLYHSTLFEELGMQYVGPLDGHSLPSLVRVFLEARQYRTPLLVHAITTKGRGYRPAERNPGAYHGISAAPANPVPDPDDALNDSFSNVFGKKLAALARDDDSICAITAAMKYGTGLQHFKRAYPGRFFDVGMAEEHAVTFAAGLAKGGCRPVVAIYSSFLQRAYDQIIHDVVLNGQDVLFAVDRAGFVPGDGATHQGIYDAAFLSQQKDMPVVAPFNYEQLSYWLERLLNHYTGPRAIRYPRGEELPQLQHLPCSGKSYEMLAEKPGAGCVAVSYGPEVAEVLDASKVLEDEGIPVDVCAMVWLNPLEEELLARLEGYELILFAEEGVRQGGIGEHVAARLMQRGYRGRFVHKAVDDVHIGAAQPGEIRALCGLDPVALADVLRSGGSKV